MLTKEFIKYRVRQGRVSPVLLKSQDREREQAAAVAGVFATAAGKTRADVEGEVSDIDGTLAPAFAKLCWDKTSESEDDGSVAEARWQVLEQAEQLRRTFLGSLVDFRRQVAGARDPDEVSRALYADLPECRMIDDAPTLTGDQLIERYNIAQVQGLVLRCRRLSVGLSGTTVAERRRFFGRLRFFRLFAQTEQDPEDKQFSVELSGPLSLFEASQAYGLRLAGLVPTIFSLSKYKLEAEIKLPQGDASLEISHRSKRFCPVAVGDSPIAGELAQLIEAVNKKLKTGFRLEANSEFLHLGGGSYCFPDLRLETPSGAKHIELFHRWFKHQLQQRLELKAWPDSLICGVDRQVAKSLGDELERHPVFLFREFPTPGQILKICY